MESNFRYRLLPTLSQQQPLRSIIISHRRNKPRDKPTPRVHVIGHGIGGKIIPAKMARLAKSQSLE